ncbi:recombinase family protein [Alkalihalobacillus hwajinpoensis]|uniref:recombinase family protein n=1 Tax=Guptibacillus hwajinpoensis TaxID=208199 RepID=UPI0018843397|nr:recombinase family protein [Pseudalkalibacillus hwajinpoensis]MBF0709393.1 recombinase family protein [Pseudalkalibacillus hwajinpoensis]
MRCAVYVRVSTDKEEQKASLLNQKNLFAKYVSENNWDIHQFYVDVESGTTDKREQLQQLIADAKAKKFDVILAKELSRLARNGGLSYQIRDIAQQHKIHIITLDNAINTLEGNSHMFGIYAWMYEEESQRTSNRVKTSLKTRAEQGLFKGSNAPYGYNLTGSKLYIRNDYTPAIVRRIYNDYIFGKGFDRIAKELYNEGLPTPAQLASKKNASDKWQGSSIRVILTNPHYTGDLVQGRTTTRSVTNKMRDQKSPKDYIIIPNTHEAIISKRDFETVQQLIKSRKKTRPQVEKHLFTNTAYCADCGRGMHYKSNCKGYMCGNYNKHGIKACTDHLVRETDLQLVILNDIKNLIDSIHDKAIVKSLDSKLKKQRQIALKNIDSQTKEIEALNMRKKKTLSLLVDEVISKEAYDDFIKDINESINKLVTNQNQSKISLESTDNKIAINEIKQALEEFIDLKELTPEILHRLIDRIEIKADGSPRIFYRFSNPSAYSLLRSINAQHSTCVVCGNISTG